MIKINKKDSIIDILIKINHCIEEKIILEFPFGHPVLHNFTSLKILKNHTGDKDLVIITSDLTAKKLGKKLGIKYSLIKNKDIIEYNYSFFEYLQFIIRSYSEEAKRKFIDKNHKKLKKSLNIKNSRMGFFIFGFIVSLLLFLFVFYFAVNKTYIYIKPEIIIKNKATNLLFEEKKQSNNSIEQRESISLKKISKLVYLENIFRTSGIDQNSIRQSSGEVIFSNKYPEDVKLRASTRIITGSGIIYTINESITIPAAITNENGYMETGKIKSKVLANLFDDQGEIIGVRGNISSGEFLSLPGLTSGQDMIFATASTNFKGGKDTYDYILSEEDIKNAQIILEEKLKKQAIVELKNQIEAENKHNNISYEILGIDEIISYSELDILGLDILKVGNKQETFSLNGTLRITSFIYNKEQVISKIKSIVKQTTLEEIENFLYLNEQSLRLPIVLSKTTNPLRIKATVQAEAFYSHNFLNKSDAYIEKLKNSIIGLDKKEAQKILLNNSKISDVEIETRPFFIKNISKIPQNIIFKVVEN